MYVKILKTQTTVILFVIMALVVLNQNFMSKLNHYHGCVICTWVRSRNCGCLVTWFCYQLIAKPGNKTAAVPWPDPHILVIVRERVSITWYISMLRIDGKYKYIFKFSQQKSGPQLLTIKMLKTGDYRIERAWYVEHCCPFFSNFQLACWRRRMSEIWKQTRRRTVSKILSLVSTVIFYTNIILE